MSYILDALRRADAERQQGGVPGLHTPTGAQAPAPPARPPWLLWAGVAVLCVGAAVALAGWWAWPPAVGVVPASPPAAVAVVPAAVAAPQPQPLPIVVSAPPADLAVAPPRSTPPASAVSPTPPAPTVQSLKLAQLPAEQRRELPPLVVGGSVWSDSAASRFVILDGQVAREGDTVAPGLVLERIQTKAVLLRWRGLRIELAL